MGNTNYQEYLREIDDDLGGVIKSFNKSLDAIPSKTLVDKIAGFPIKAIGKAGIGLMYIGKTILRRPVAVVIMYRHTN